MDFEKYYNEILINLGNLNHEIVKYGQKTVVENTRLLEKIILLEKENKELKEELQKLRQVKYLVSPN